MQAVRRFQRRSRLKPGGNSSHRGLKCRGPTPAESRMRLSPLPKKPEDAAAGVSASSAPAMSDRDADGALPPPAVKLRGFEWVKPGRTVRAASLNGTSKSQTDYRETRIADSGWCLVNGISKSKRIIGETDTLRNRFV